PNRTRFTLTTSPILSPSRIPYPPPVRSDPHAPQRRARDRTRRRASSSGRGGPPPFTAVAARPVPVGARQEVRDGHLRHRADGLRDRKSTRLNSSHVKVSYAVFCSKKKWH